MYIARLCGRCLHTRVRAMYCEGPGKLIIENRTESRPERDFGQNYKKESRDKKIFFFFLYYLRLLFAFSNNPHSLRRYTLGVINIYRPILVVCGVEIYAG